MKGISRKQRHLILSYIREVSPHGLVRWDDTRTKCSVTDHNRYGDTRTLHLTFLDERMLNVLEHIVYAENKDVYVEYETVTWHVQKSRRAPKSGYSKFVFKRVTYTDNYLDDAKQEEAIAQ